MFTGDHDGGNTFEVELALQNGAFLLESEFDNTILGRDFEFEGADLIGLFGDVEHLPCRSSNSGGGAGGAGIAGGAGGAFTPTRTGTPQRSSISLAVTPPTKPKSQWLAEESEAGNKEFTQDQLNVRLQYCQKTQNGNKSKYIKKAYYLS